MNARTVRHRADRTRRRRAGFWSQPIVSPYTDRLQDAAFGSHRCYFQMFGPLAAVGAQRATVTIVKP
jgi:hypothetical protein